LTARRICKKSLLTQILLLAADTNLGYCIFSNVFVGLLQNQVPRGSALVNLTTDRKSVIKQRVWFSAFCASNPNRFGSKLYEYEVIIITVTSHFQQAHKS